jgi:hypothetical protein
MNRLRVGDFDGDGFQDLFLATGTAWYYSSGGKTEWRFLSAKKETVENLLFGDLDGDGRTDVFTQMVNPETDDENCKKGDNAWMVSWGGISPWECINHSQWSLKDFYIGDFVGDGRDDVFFARGDWWFVSDGGRGPFVPYAQSSFKLPDLAFGHFDSDKTFGNDKKIDVIGVVMNDQHVKQWMVVHAQDPEHKWRPLRPALTNTMAGVTVADFDGDGFSDIAINLPFSYLDKNQISHRKVYRWKVSRNGKSDWESQANYATPEDAPEFVAIGRFIDKKRADMLIWDHLWFKMFSKVLSADAATQRYTPQEMR